ncbi:MAG TPA: iron-sulfur cluster repair di-iron protein [Lentimicrobium sp.]|nr:iron-sulfur cluster repair di-iron protein [Lentimicrobium sp.]
MVDIKERTVGSIVSENLLIAPILDKYGIDYCCKGSRKLVDVCRLQQLDVEKLTIEISEVKEKPVKGGHDYDEWPIDLLADYIEKTHHRFAQKAIPEIVRKLEKITNVHGKAHPELNNILKLFKESAIALSNHMKKEEFILFPYIKKMVNEGKSSSDEIPDFSTLSNPIFNMMEEHVTEGERFHEIEKLTKHYTVPPDGCNSYRLSMEMLKEFDEDLHLHIHLENNILFPKAMRLE